jgi:hypothetical protein
MSELETNDGLRDDLRAAWHRYVDLVLWMRANRADASGGGPRNVESEAIAIPRRSPRAS